MTSKPTPTGLALTNVMLDLFKLNSSILTAGDRLVSDLGLTSSRWQVLGHIVASDSPQPVARLARNMGANRQNIQRIVNDLVKEDLVTFQPNPHHARARLVVLTSKGEQAYDAAIARQIPWFNKLAEGLEVAEIKAMHQLILKLNERLGENEAIDKEL
ncbi:MarR family winged helix-turn-helix transcriptional regulator [Psychrobacter pygoscelis]|uniref:MarR family winged helix-turn-helix transcriptional regulator n=1 Tax=Psychrobacter pygoscelis TaxID=2488563 RepID=UPI00103E5197|nr:MarR family winged helix-turn-helix transcriptional regulator [Psychrobacter pygoscelis]